MLLFGRGFFFFVCLLAPLDSASDPLGLCLTKKLSIVICFFFLRFKMFLKWHLALSLKMTGLRVRNSRHSSQPRGFVFGKFVRKPNCSWSEAFVNRGLTAYPLPPKFCWLGVDMWPRNSWMSCMIQEVYIHASLNHGDTFWEMRRQAISSLCERHWVYLPKPR